MKKLAILILSALFLITGCQDDNSILEPTNDYANYEMSKGRPILTDDAELKFTTDSDIDDLVINSKYSKTFTVDGKKGGKLSVKHSWINENGQKSNLSAALVIPRGAYEGKLTFNVLFDLNNYSVELYPSPFTFDIPISLNLIFSGIDMSNLDTKDLDFDYLDGEPENLKYDYLEIDVANRMLEVSGAQIPHFSRYGWTRTTTSK